jgi:hypothetical protein
MSASPLAGASSGCRAKYRTPPAVDRKIAPAFRGEGVRDRHFSLLKALWKISSHFQSFPLNHSNGLSGMVETDARSP